MKDIRIYEIGDVTLTLEKTSSGYYTTTAEWDGHKFRNMFSTREQALDEILSYAELSEYQKGDSNEA